MLQGMGILSEIATGGLFAGNTELLKGDLSQACTCYDKAGPEGWLPWTAVLIHTSNAADVAALLRTAVYRALTTLHERPRPAASFSVLSPQFRRPTADRNSECVSMA